MSIVSDWFGPQFQQLHPLLQELHLHGGALHGTVDVTFGSGVAGTLGKKLAAKLGLPETPGPHMLDVEIRHSDFALIWSRRFNKLNTMTSVFLPVGHWPDGYWIENTGGVRMELGVDVTEGQWHWRYRSLKAFRVAVPLRWFLRATAFKRIENDRYYFYVGFSLPKLGLLMSYGGALDPQTSPDVEADPTSIQ